MVTGKMAFIRSLLVSVTGYVLITGVSLVIAGFVLETIDDNAYCDTEYCPHRSYLRMHKRLKEDGLLL